MISSSTVNAHVHSIPAVAWRSYSVRLAVLFATMLLWPSAGHAGTDIDFRVHTPGLSISSVGHRYYHSSRHHRSYPRHNRQYRYRGYRNNGHRGYRNNGYRANRYRYNRSPSYSNAPRFYSHSRIGGSRACRNVSKDGYWRGHPAVVGGRECYDRYGRAYISPNSRYLIRYY